MAGLLNYAPAFRTVPAFRGLDGFRSPLFDLVDRIADSARTDGVNIARLGDDSFRVELAVPGFVESEVEITVEDRILTVKGTKPEATEDGVTYVTRGFAPASFERRFTLAEHVEVESADLKAGVLSIALVRKLPEARQPKRIAIGAVGTA
ncbi:heat-shock protein Hsp20 [Tistrella bauzanensis]|uniref:Heat-shock protein Hsp20 n=1 Tax=Tistrella bauzanensis TaxID=657419 RepID=A0ABQ1I939_9PROT|nr:Hsp20 family protein [Tistrella bauzanensis]GGB28980.1 heat-shock protein Hsp20 [Tistrella bauzanensis]